VIKQWICSKRKKEHIWIHCKNYQISFYFLSYGHNDDINGIDCISDKDFITCGSDNQVIYWKTDEESQLVYTGHKYAIDCIGAISEKSFVTGS